MLKHIEDNGDLTVFANDSGSVLLVCESCKRQWIVESAAGTRDMGVAREARSVVDSLRANPEVLEGTSVSIEDLT